MNKLYSIKAPYFLIQTVRANQALMEAGVKVGLPKKSRNIYSYLTNYFSYNIHLGEGATLDAEICHATPFVRIGNLTKPLLFPHAVIDKYKASWGKRNIKFFFQGLVPPHREPLLAKWKTRAKINATDNGRTSLKRFWDSGYVNQMGHSEFILCPIGGFNWSYRFYEAVLCGATPIISHPSPLYDGYYYHTWNDEVFEQKYTQENFELACKQLTASRDEILENIYALD